MTVRIDSELLIALKERAHQLGRSVSSEVLQMIRQQILPRPKKSGPLRSSAGMFSYLGEAPSIQEIRDLRSLNSKKIGAFVP